MNGIIILAHANLASAMLDCVSHIYGYMPENIIAIDVKGDEQTHNIHSKMTNWINTTQYDGYLILNDLYGASPFNMGKSFIEKYDLQIKFKRSNNVITT